MAMGIPLPQNNRSGLFEGMLAGHKRRDAMEQANQQMQQQQAQLQQQWRQHLENIAIKKQQEQRLGEAATREAELHPWQRLFEQTRAENEGKKYSPEQQQAKLDLVRAKEATERAKAENLKKGGNQRVTAAIQEADALYNGNREHPGWSQYVFNKNKQYAPTQNQTAEDEKFTSSPEFQKIAPYLNDAIDMNYMPAGTQNYYRKQMNDELGQIDKAKQVKHAISQARGIVKNNPGLYKKAINIIANPEATPGSMEKALTAFMPEKDVNAFMTLGKLYADILTKQAQLNGMSRSVYALRLQQQAKAQVKNPDDVNEQIFKNIEYEIAPQIDREKALIYAMKHNQYLPLTKEYGEREEPQNEISANNSDPWGIR